VQVEFPASRSVHHDQSLPTVSVLTLGKRAGHNATPVTEARSVALATLRVRQRSWAFALAQIFRDRGRRGSLIDVCRCIGSVWGFGHSDGPAVAGCALVSPVGGWALSSRRARVSGLGGYREFERQNHGGTIAAPRGYYDSILRAAEIVGTDCLEDLSQDNLRLGDVPIIDMDFKGSI
jgi:hypothetical protein